MEIVRSVLLATVALAAWAAPAAAQASAEAPFSVSSRGRPLPRGERAVVVLGDSAAPRPAPADTARAPAATPTSTPSASGGTAVAGTGTRAGTGSAATAPTPRPDTGGAAPATRPSSPARPATATRTHVVQWGETFYGIANRYGVSFAALRAANPGVDQERLTSGTRLNIPAPAAAAPARRTHRVQPGETLTGIARRYEVSLRALREANDLENDDRVRSGQTLVIPTEEDD